MLGPGGFRSRFPALTHLADFRLFGKMFGLIGDVCFDVFYSVRLEEAFVSIRVYRLLEAFVSSLALLSVVSCLFVSQSQSVNNRAA